MDKQNFKEDLKDLALTELLEERKNIQSAKKSSQIQESLKTNYLKKVNNYKKNATIYTPNPSDANQEDGGSPSSPPPLKKSKTLHFTQSQKDLEKKLSRSSKGHIVFPSGKIIKVNYDDFIHDFRNNIKTLHTLSQSDINLLAKELKKKKFFHKQNKEFRN